MSQQTMRGVKGSSWWGLAKRLEEESNGTLAGYAVTYGFRPGARKKTQHQLEAAVIRSVTGLGWASRLFGRASPMLQTFFRNDALLWTGFRPVRRCSCSV